MYEIITDRDLVSSVAVAIATHPLVTNAEVYLPNNPDQKIALEKIKLYGGREITDPNLTLGVYQDMASLGNGERGYLREEQISITPNHTSEACYLITAHFNAQLSLRLSEFDEPLSIKYGVKPSNLNEAHTDSLYLAAPPVTYQEQSLDLFVLPAVEVLKDWVTLIRQAIRDIRYLKPYKIRGTQIKSVEYASVTPFDVRPEQLVFHQATVKFQLMYGEGNLAPLLRR